MTTKELIKGIKNEFDEIKYESDLFQICSLDILQFILYIICLALLLPITIILDILLMPLEIISYIIYRKNKEDK